jgi:hypothetical protein
MKTQKTVNNSSKEMKEMEASMQNQMFGKSHTTAGMKIKNFEAGDNDLIKPAGESLKVIGGLFGNE